MSFTGFNDKSLADVTIKFSGQELFAHKVVLARSSNYFLRAFTGQFPVSSSNEIDLGDDEEPEVIQAMIRYIYGLPWDSVSNSAKNGTKHLACSQNLEFQINLFEAADKYDVPTLRPIIVTAFKKCMAASYESEEFSKSIQKLCGPSAIRLADSSLHDAAVTFCLKNIPKLMLQKNFVSMIEGEEPFSGRLLTKFLRDNKSQELVLQTCNSDSCRKKREIESSLPLSKCVHCGITDSYYGNTKLSPWKKVWIMELDPARSST